MSPIKPNSPLRRIGAILAAFAVMLVGTFCGAETSVVSESPHRSPPDTFIFLVDISGSMKDQLSVAVQPRLTNQSKLQQVKARLTRLAQDFPKGTRVIVSVFDDQRSQVCDVVLDSRIDRDDLATKIAEIHSRDGATLLWGSVDKELARAEQLVAASKTRVRLVVYSDGDDSDNSPVINHRTLIDRYRHIIDRELQLDDAQRNFLALPNLPC